VWHISNAFTIPEQERLAKRLTQKTFADYVAFQNSGAEATEAAIKFARRYFYSKGQPKKNRILCINNSFHGRTIATIFASNSKKATEGFGPKVDGFDHFNFGDHKALEKAITRRTAAIMVETIMGEGGIKVIPDWCLRELRKICNKKNILLILDEVQCGIGRSGDFFAFEKSKVKPDIVPIAKGIGGGFPIGAVLMNKKVASGMTAGTHGSTFGGNPLAMAVGNSVMDIISNKKFLKNVKSISEYFLSNLKKILKDNKELSLVIKSPLITSIDKLNIFESLLKKINANELTSTFLKVIQKNKRFSNLASIITQFMKINSQKRGDVLADITSADELNDEQKNNITNQLKSMLGDKLYLSFDVDKNIMGGLIVKVGSKMIDTSLANKINKLKIEMKGE